MTDAKNIEIQLTEEIAQGVFANMAIINHTDSEFVFDFVYLQPNVPKGKVRSRVIMTPEHVKRIASAIEDNLKKYESKHGPIKVKGPNPENL